MCVNACRCQAAASSHVGKPLHVEVKDDNIVLELPNVLAMKSIESRIAVLFNSSDSVSVGLCTVTEGCLTLSVPRIHWLYTCKEPKPTGVVPVSEFTIVTSASFHQKSESQLGYLSSVLDIGDGLFSVLFGLELNLARCPVLLLGGRDGLVLWLAMKSVIGCPTSVQVLCSLGDSLVRVLSFSSSHDDGTSPSSSCLVLVGHHGHVVVISLSAGATKPSYQHCDILGPVQCCTSFDNSKLLYSTDNELYVADVVMSVQSDQPGSMKSSALGISGITALSTLHSAEEMNGTTLGKLLIL